MTQQPIQPLPQAPHGIDLPPLPAMPPLTDEEAIGRATDQYVVQGLKIERQQIDHLVDSHEGHWTLTPRERWMLYVTGPKRDHDRLMAALQQEQQEQADYERAVGQQTIANEGKPPPAGQEIMPPVPLLTDRERERHDEYMNGEREPFEIWLTAIAEADPEEGEKTMRDYARLLLEYGDEEV